MPLIRSPMLSQADKVEVHSELSFGSEIDVIRALSATAKKVKRIHGIILMVELGDLREGIMPKFLEKSVHSVLGFSNTIFMGIGTNLACRSGVSHDCRNMEGLSVLANSIEAIFDPIVNTVPGGNSANLKWALSGVNTGRINNLRLGEALLLGCEPLHRRRIQGLHTDTITLVGEVIELKSEPSKPWGTIAQSAFGEVASDIDRGRIPQASLAIGRQDLDPTGLVLPPGLKILAASSDHLVIDASHYRGAIRVGTEIPLQLDYSALLRAMTSPFVSRVTMMPRTQIHAESL